MIFRAVASLAIGALIWPGTAGPVEAQQSFSAEQARNAVRSGDILPLKDIFDTLEDEFGGYQLDVDLFSTSVGGSEYHIEWMSEDGRWLEIVVDAQTGDLVSTSGD